MKKRGRYKGANTYVCHFQNSTFASAYLNAHVEMDTNFSQHSWLPWSEPALAWEELNSSEVELTCAQSQPFMCVEIYVYRTSYVHKKINLHLTIRTYECGPVSVGTNSEKTKL